MSRFNLDQVIALREYEKACMSRGESGLRRSLQYFVDYVLCGGRFARPLSEGAGIDTFNLLELWITAKLAGWSSEELNSLAQDMDALQNFLEVHRGLAEIKPISRILDCSQPFNAAQFTRQNFTIWRGPIDGDGLDPKGEEDLDIRALTLATVDFAQAGFETCFIGEETSIKGEDKLTRLKQRLDLIRLGGQQFQALWRDYQQNGEKSVLEWLRRTKGITYLDFPGLVLRSPDGYRYVLVLYWDGKCWRWSYDWLNDEWLGLNFSVVSPASISA